MLKTLSLLAASTAIVAAGTAGAQVANVYPAANINGNGASTVANTVGAELNCYGNATNSPIGISPSGGTLAIFDHNYQPAKVTTGNPNYNCATQSVQPNVTGRYVSTGSGGGITSFINKNSAGITNPAAFGAWNNIQFAFSETPLSAANLATYAAATGAGGTGNYGAAIQLPILITPIAFAYAPVYGKVRTASGVTNLTFNIKTPRADGTGGLKLTRAAYCGIVNGTITNWNDAALTAANGGLSLRNPADDLTRWNTAGVPIRLIGRSDSSGGTTLFTRHISAVCGGKFDKGGQSTLTAATTGASSTIVSGAVYNQTTGALQSGTEAAGLWGVASGSSGVAAATNLAPADPVNVGDYTFNGKLSYLGADWVLPALITGSQLASADLPVNNSTTKFAAPTAANATAAFKGVLPPQSASNGSYSPAATANGLRSDPLAWVVPANATTGIVNPVAGYPIVGTANMLLYTCYNTAEERNAVQGLLLLSLGKITTDSTGAKIPAKLFTNTGKDINGLPLGLLGANGIAPLSGPFAKAIFETFAIKSSAGANPGALNLWIQDKQPKKTADIATAVSNPTCTAGQGA